MNVFPSEDESPEVKHPDPNWDVSTHWCINTMASTLQTTSSKLCSCRKSVPFWFNSGTELLFANDPINNTSAPVQIMAWRRPGGKHLSQPIITHFTDVYSTSPLCVNPTVGISISSLIYIKRSTLLINGYVIGIHEHPLLAWTDHTFAQSWYFVSHPKTIPLFRASVASTVWTYFLWPVVFLFYP